MIHFIVGLLAGIISFFNPVASSLIVLLFIIYEIWEDRVKHDRDYISIAEFTAGFVTGIYIIQIINYVIHGGYMCQAYIRP